MEFTQDRLPVHFLAVLQHALNDTAPVWVCSQSVNLALEGIYNKLDILRRDSLDGLLDDMIAVLVPNTAKDVALQFFDH